MKISGDSVVFSWPKGQGQNGRPASSKTFAVAGIKKELTAAGIDVGPSKLCVPFQFMYAMSSNFGDDDKRLVRPPLLPRLEPQHHNSVTASAHEQLSGLDRAMLLRHES